MPNANRIPRNELILNISPTIERDYRRRNVFPALRLENAPRFINATGVHYVSIVEAETILKDADAQRGDRSLPRGTPKAFSSLVEKLTAAIKSAKGLWDDPGIEEMRQRLQESPAQCRVGEWVRYWPEWTDDERDGALLEIIEGYALYRVIDEDGAFIDKDADCASYQWGYAARDRDGETTFYAAYNLQRLDYKRGHLRLVETRRAADASAHGH